MDFLSVLGEFLEIPAIHTHTLFGTPCQSVRNYLALPFNGAHDHMTPVPRLQLINKLTTRYTERKKCYTLLVQAQESN